MHYLNCAVGHSLISFGVRVYTLQAPKSQIELASDLKVSHTISCALGKAMAASVDCHDRIRWIIYAGLMACIVGNSTFHMWPLILGRWTNHLEERPHRLRYAAGKDYTVKVSNTTCTLLIVLHCIRPLCTNNNLKYLNTELWRPIVTCLPQTFFKFLVYGPSLVVHKC